MEPMRDNMANMLSWGIILIDCSPFCFGFIGMAKLLSEPIGSQTSHQDDTGGISSLYIHCIIISNNISHTPVIPMMGDSSIKT